MQPPAYGLAVDLDQKALHLTVAWLETGHDPGPEARGRAACFPERAIDKTPVTGPRRTSSPNVSRSVSVREILQTPSDRYGRDRPVSSIVALRERAGATAVPGPNPAARGQGTRWRSCSPMRSTTFRRAWVATCSGRARARWRSPWATARSTTTRTGPTPGTTMWGRKPRRSRPCGTSPPARRLRSTTTASRAGRGRCGSTFSKTPQGGTGFDRGAPGPLPDHRRRPLVRVADQQQGPRFDATPMAPLAALRSRTTQELRMARWPGEPVRAQSLRYLWRLRGNPRCAWVGARASPRGRHAAKPLRSRINPMNVGLKGGYSNFNLVESSRWPASCAPVEDSFRFWDGVRP